MNFVADEGVDRQIVEALRQNGHNVLYIAEMAPGTTDTQVLQRANTTDALLLTVDKDFGEIVFRQQLTTAGVILLRIEGLPTERKINAVLTAISTHAAQLPHAFTVISPRQIRVRQIIR